MFLAFVDGYLHRQETSSREFLSRLKLLMIWLRVGNYLALYGIENEQNLFLLPGEKSASFLWLAFKTGTAKLLPPKILPDEVLSYFFADLSRYRTQSEKKFG